MHRQKLTRGLPLIFALALTGAASSRGHSQQIEADVVVGGYFPLFGQFDTKFVGVLDFAHTARHTTGLTTALRARCLCMGRAGVEIAMSRTTLERRIVQTAFNRVTTRDAEIRDLSGRLIVDFAQSARVTWEAFAGGGVVWVMGDAYPETPDISRTALVASANPAGHLGLRLKARLRPWAQFTLEVDNTLYVQDGDRPPRLPADPMFQHDVAVLAGLAIRLR